MQGNSENPACYVLGQGKHKTLTLKLPLLISECGLVQANSPSTRYVCQGGNFVFKIIVYLESSCLER